MGKMKEIWAEQEQQDNELQENYQEMEEHHIICRAAEIAAQNTDMEVLYEKTLCNERIKKSWYDATDRRVM